MLHAFRIAPFDASAGAISIYAARDSSGEVVAAQATNDVEGLRALTMGLAG